ncbi:sensor histidine kinase, partial [Staphylococcus aureus]|uniref:sensor histidine kinase n=1 Tax=Staphylococcus aureus TaxID=1280 RepID=UPI0037DA0441
IPLSPKLPQTLVQQLSQILPYSLPTNSHTLQLNQHFNYIQHYLAIQNIPFDHIIKLHIQTSQQPPHHTIPKIILHPLIENPIKHGTDTQSLDITIPLTLPPQNL